MTVLDPRLAVVLILGSIAHGQVKFPHDCRFLYVSGAGYETVNGWYVPAGTYERKLQWCREDAKCYSGSRAVFWSIRGYWALSNNDRLYKLTALHDLDLPVGDVWTPVNSGEAPAPTVTCHAERLLRPSSCAFLVVQGAGESDIDGVYESFRVYNKHRSWRRLNPAEGSVVVYLSATGGWELSRGYLPASLSTGTTPLYQEPSGSNGNDVPVPEGWVPHFGRAPAPQFSCQNHPRMPPPSDGPCR